MKYLKLLKILTDCSKFEYFDIDCDDMNNCFLYQRLQILNLVSNVYTNNLKAGRQFEEMIKNILLWIDYFDYVVARTAIHLYHSIRRDLAVVVQVLNTFDLLQGENFYLNIPERYRRDTHDEHIVEVPMYRKYEQLTISYRGRSNFLVPIVFR